MLFRSINMHPMRTLVIPCCIVLLLFSACKKEEAAQPQQLFNGPGLETGTRQGYLTWEEFGDETGFIYTPYAGAIPFRFAFPDSFAIDWIAEDYEPVEMVSDIAPDQTTYGIHDPGSTRWWIPVWSGASGVYTVQTQEYGSALRPSHDAGDHWRWIRHQVDTEDGNPVYVFESYMYPGFFWSQNPPLACHNCLGMNETTLQSAHRFTFR
jgi:hypothetical protein